jgi:hypothetical protein
VSATADGAALGSRIAAARRDAGLSQRELADALETSLFSVARLESGSADPSSQLTDIADITRHDLSWFVAPSTPRLTTRPAARLHLDGLGDLGRDLVIGALVVLVTVRFFTEVVPVVPRAANFIDIPIFLALALAALRAPCPPKRAYLPVAAPALAFVSLAVASAILNTGRVQAAPFLVFVYGFLSPLGVYAATYRVWPAGNARFLSRTVVLLGVLQLAVVALIGIPRFVASAGNPDEIGGTFGTNAYQLVFFLLVVAALLAGIFTLERDRFAARIAPLLVLCIFAVVLLAQYRALLATTVLVMVAAGVLLGTRPRGIALAIVAAVAFAATFSFISSEFPRLKLRQTASTLTESPWSYAQQRWEASKPVRRLYGDVPRAVVIGAGPATFSSRAWQTFAKAGSDSRSNVQGGYAERLVDGEYQTDVSEEYVVPQLEQGTIVEGSRALSQPYSSYLGLAAEAGLFALVLIVGVYLLALVRSALVTQWTIRHATPTDSVPALALAATIGFLLLLQMGLLENWLEVTRATFLVWVIFAVVAKEVDAR